jgi:2-dehydro-3-deoxygluconokinase
VRDPNPDRANVVDTGRFDIVALGEPMVEFNQTRDQGGRVFLQGFGGDTSNFAIAAARQGARVAFVSALGDDPYGRMLRELWVREHVDHGGVLTHADAFTAIYFVTHDDDGHHFHFFRKGSAASRLQPSELPLDSIRNARVLHLSGISLALSEQARDTCWAAIDVARKAGVAVSFDTNLRLKLWSLDQAREAITQALRWSDMALPSYDDMQAITGLREPDAIVDHCLKLGPRIVALKLGEQGAIVATVSERHRIAAHPCQPVDATGAGDTFGGAFMARWLAGDGLNAAGRYAAVAAALSTQGYGAVEPIPRAAQVRDAMLAAG